MISTNSKDYATVFKDFLDLSICAEAIKELEKAEWQEHTFYCEMDNKYYSFDNELSMSHELITQRPYFMQRCWDALQKYFTEALKDHCGWYNGWNGHTPVRFNKYDPSKKMKIHCDHITSMFDGTKRGIPTLTVLGVMNDDYEGGEFVMWGGEVIDMPAGSVIVFPSNFMFPHEVLPVKSGVRHSFVSWAW